MIRGHSATAAAATRPLVFGIYPGGAAGTVGAGATPVPENPAKRLAALEELRPAGAPFVLHLYASFTGAGGASAEQQLGEEIVQYAAAGLEVELVLAYRPADGGSPADAEAFARFAAAAVDAFGSLPQFVSLQVTNEANVGGSPNTSDGFYADVEEALVDGVIAAKSAARSAGYSQVKIGFNWAYSLDANEAGFWSELAQLGGPSFIADLDWVGLDVYPGTWGPPISGDLASGTRTAVLASLATLRRWMESIGVPAATPIHISENGYPTGPGRTGAMQVTAMKASIAAVAGAAAAYNVSDYRWFDLRDASSSSSSFEDQYGIMTDAYAPKPAFSTYRSLIAEYS